MLKRTERSSNLKRQVSPGLAAVMVIGVLAMVQYVWYVGLVKKPTTPMGQPKSGGGPPPANKEVLLQGRDYVALDTIAGDTEPGFEDGAGYRARFDRPGGIAIAADGTLFIADTGNCAIRTMRPDGSVSTLAGNGVPGSVDGPVRSAKFRYPGGVTVAPDGSVYVADTGNASVRRIKDGQVTTVVTAGKGALTAARGFVPCALCIKPGGNLLVADVGSKALWEFSPGGTVVMNTPGAAAPTSIECVQAPLLCMPEIGDIRDAAKDLKSVDIAGADQLDDVKRRPRIAHPVNAIRIGSGIVALDAMHSSVFLIKNGLAEVLAGLTSSAGPVRDYKDGNGEIGFFNVPVGLATDGHRYIYVSDSASCCIRRLTAPDFLFH
jgi:NHL repeat